MPTKIKTIDIALIIIPIILLAIGVAEIYSLLFGSASAGLGLKQGIIGIVGIVLMSTIFFVDYRIFKATSWVFYLISLILLILVDLFGKTVNGATHWIELGFFQLQPSEIAKISLVFSLSGFFSDRIGKLKWKDILLSFILILPPLILILREPDLGTSLVIIFCYIVLLIAARPSRTQAAIISISILSILAVAGMAYMKVKPLDKIFKDYQRERIAVFLDPNRDPKGRGYNVRQAQITIGTGGAFGEGLGKGTQSQLQFLPEAHTDFIFAGVSESFGFVGSFLVIVLYCFFIIRLLDVARKARDNFGFLTVIGITAIFFFHIFVNIGMNLGVMPVTGIPLPFLSYGGTAVLVSFFSLGVVESILIRHKKNLFN